MTDSEPKVHAAIADIEYAQGSMLWAGRKVSDIVEDIGRTPTYIYSRNRIASQIERLRNALPTTLKLHYAMKANPMPEVVEYVASLVDGLDVASAGELKIALATDTAPARISFAGPGKQDWELEQALRAGITINVESEGELRRLAAIANDVGTQPAIAIRVNPLFELKSAGMKMGGRPSQFGIDAERVPNVLAELETLNLRFRGFHVFSGSQNLRADAIAESIANTVDLVIALANATKMEVEFVNLGGGLGIPYFPREEPVNLAEVADPIATAIDKLSVELGGPETAMELGRYLVGEAGIYVCRVVDVKVSRGLKFVITDGGLHHHLAASGNFGQVLRKNYPVVATELTAQTETASVVGPLCTPLDLLGDRVDISAVDVGSLIAVLQSGAYGPSASPADFLSHRHCAQVLI